MIWRGRLAGGLEIPSVRRYVEKEKTVTDAPTSKRAFAIIVAVITVTVTMMALDLTWLGIVARGIYDSSLGPLKRQEVFWPAALLFYALYVAAIVIHAVAGSTSGAQAFKRGAGIGLLSYGTYDLTNWAVLAGWPAAIVPIDIAWGIVLTATVSFLGKRAMMRAERAS
ncbi:MAG: DUF2177 family protein [Polyangiaceae bacterium]|nr:DUF2177 family protein [Polyangiaceae bacterium]